MSSFYVTLGWQLAKLQFSGMQGEEIERFRNYILYAFNYDALVRNDLTIASTYRLVVNESVTGKNERITQVADLAYPPLDVVRMVNRYNRANTPNSNLFYTSESVDATLKELRPPVNKLVTLGIWRPKSPHPFVSYPISHSLPAVSANEGVRAAFNAFESRSGKVDPQIHDYLRFYLNLIGAEYTKPVSHHQEYMVSAWLSERILGNREEPYKYDCIIYPSVGNELRADNIAMLPAVVDERMRLERVIEFEVEEPFYHKGYSEHHPEHVTLARIKNVVEARQVGRNGLVEW